MPAGTPDDDVVIGLQWHRGRGGDAVHEGPSEHRANLAAENLAVWRHAFARRIGTQAGQGALLSQPYTRSTSGHENIARSLAPRVWSEQIPAVALEIEEYRHAAVWLIARWRDEPHAGSGHALEGRLEIIDPQEHADAPCELLSDDLGLLVAVGTREENARLASVGPDHDPSFRPAIIGQRRRVFDQFELQDIDEETASGVVVADHQRHEREVCHRVSDYSAPRGCRKGPQR